MLATLVLLSYSKLLRTIITAFIPAKFDRTVRCRVYRCRWCQFVTESVWKFDGEINYGQFLKHCTLLVLAILFFLWLPYTFILLCYSYIRRWKIIARLGPSLSLIYIGPLTPTCQFWIGLLLLIRCVLLISLIFLRPDASVLSMVVIIILIIVLLYNTGSIYNHNTDISKYICCKSFPKFFQQLLFYLCSIFPFC